VHLADINGGGDIVHRRVLVQCVTDCDDWSAVASAHARGADNPDPVAEPPAQSFKELSRTGKFAAEAVAHPQCQQRRWRLIIHYDVEMRIERGDLIDFDECQPHFLRKRRQVACMQAAKMVLQQMQVLDHQVTPALTLSEQRLYFG
jgi:hypothetical protein